MGYDIGVSQEFKSPLPERPIPGGEEKVENRTSFEGGVNKVSEVKVADEAKKDIKKEIIIGIAVVAGIIGLIFGIKAVINRNGGSEDEKTIINYWGLWEEPGVVMAAIADFEAKNPKIKVNYVRKDIDNYRTILKGRLSKTEAEGLEIPDIFSIHSSWLPMFEAEVAPIPKEMAVELNLDEDFLGVFARDLKKDGSYLAVPLYYDGLVLYYNKNLVSKTDLPKSWWNLEQIAKKLTIKDEDGRIVQAGVAMGLADNVDHFSDIIGLMLLQAGANPMVEQVKTEDVLAYYTRFATTYQVWDETLVDSTTMFANGKLAFYFGPAWRMYNLAEMNPNLNYGVAKVPQLPTLTGVPPEEIDSEADLTNIHWASYWVPAINKNSGKKEIAFELVKYLAGKEAMARMVAASAQVRSVGLVPARKDLASGAATNEKLTALVESAPEARSGWLSSRTFDVGLNDEMIAYFKDAVNGLTLRSSGGMEAAMEALISGVKQVAGRYRIGQ